MVRGDFRWCNMGSWTKHGDFRWCNTGPVTAHDAARAIDDDDDVARGASARTRRMSSRAFAASPPDRWLALERARPGCKLITFVRHAEGFHNLRDAVTFDSTYNSALNFDARLTARGEAQCAALAASGVGVDVELVATSPMTRCVQTALTAFPNALERGVPFVANEDLRETVNYWCDRRRSTEELVSEFGDRVDFSACPPTDELWARYEAIAGPPDAWTKHRESCDLYAVANRMRSFLRWLEQRPERRVVVSTHSATLRCLFSYGHPGGVRGAPEQIFDSGGVLDTSKGAPVIDYGGDAEFEALMRADFANCECRDVVIDFSALSPREA